MKKNFHVVKNVECPKYGDNVPFKEEVKTQKIEQESAKEGGEEEKVKEEKTIVSHIKVKFLSFFCVNQFKRPVLHIFPKPNCAKI
jgi:hypothetical protein